MSTITRTYTETSGSAKSTWTCTWSASNLTITDTVSWYLPTLKAKYVGSNKGLGVVRCDSYVKGSNGYKLVGHLNWHTTPGGSISWKSMASGTTYTIPYENGVVNPFPVYASSFFTSSNPTVRTVNLDVYVTNLTLESDNSAYTNYAYYSYSSSGGNIGTVATLTLNAPPTVTLGTPTYATPHYTGMGTYSVPLTTLTARYGGNITSVKLTVGSNSTTQTYSSNTVSNKTISVTPTKAGTFTPTLAVTDSRGQVTTKTLPSITVNQYNVPSISFDVYRTDSSGVKDDEGTYGLISANIAYTSAIATLTQPVVTIDGTTTNNVTWYTSLLGTGAVDTSTEIDGVNISWSDVGSGDTVYGLINGSFLNTQSYVIGITVTDSRSGVSPTITQTLSTAFYTIDFQAGGKEIAFGAPANDNLTSYPNGLFKCSMDTLFDKDMNTDGDVVAGGDVINGDGIALSKLKSAIIIRSTSIPSTTVNANSSVWAYAEGWTPTAITGYTPMAVPQATPDTQSSLIMQVTLVPETYGNRFVGSVRNVSSSNLTDTFKIPVLYIRNDLI